MNTLATNTYSSFLDHTVTSLDTLEITETVAEREREATKHQTPVTSDLLQTISPRCQHTQSFSPQLSPQGQGDDATQHQG